MKRWPASRAAWAVAAAAGALGIAGVVLFARTRESAPIRCPNGMIALGPRCCGAGQTLGPESRCEGVPSACSPPLSPSPTGCIVDERVVSLAGGELTIGPGDWEAQGQVAPHVAAITPFRLDAFEVTEAGWRRCEEGGGCPVIAKSGEPGRAIANVGLDEARRYCLAKQGALPTVDQLAFAAASARGRRYPWGDTGAVCRRAAWGLDAGPCAERATGPELAGAHPDGATPEGVFDLAGNVAEWTEPASGASTAAVFGGSWADAEAASLRTWNHPEVSVTSRSPRIGFRCVYAAERD